MRLNSESLPIQKDYRIKILLFVITLFVFFFIDSYGKAFGWHDETHLAIAKAAGYTKWYNAVGADIAKIKAGRIERNNHHFNNNANAEVTPEMVLSQVERYNDPNDAEGHLYGAIIASLHEYTKTAQAGKYPEYHIAFCAHYVGDLSQPFHHGPDDEVNKIRHTDNDGIVEHEVMNNINRIRRNMYPIRLRKDHFEEDIAKEISRIANLSRMLGKALREDNRNMTRREAYIQLGHSASLLKAILRYFGKNH